MGSADRLHGVGLNQQPPPQFDSRPPVKDHLAGTLGMTKEEQLLGAGMTPKLVAPLMTLNYHAGECRINQVWSEIKHGYSLHTATHDKLELRQTIQQIKD